MKPPEVSIGMSFILLHCGNFLSDKDFIGKNGNYRIREIKHMGHVYRHVMLNGEVINITKIEKE